MSKLRHFLLIFDHRAGKLLRDPVEFVDGAAALDEYSRTEREYEGQEAMEIVLIGADSIETVKRTHSNYFPPSAGSEFLRDL